MCCIQWQTRGSGSNAEQACAQTNSQSRTPGRTSPVALPPSLRFKRLRAGGLSCRRLGGVDGQAQFALGGAQMFLGPGSVSFHIVVVGGAGTVHLMDGFYDVLMNAVKIVPVADLCGQRRACDK